MVTGLQSCVCEVAPNQFIRKLAVDSPRSLGHLTNSCKLNPLACDVVIEIAKTREAALFEVGRVVIHSTSK